MSAEELFFKAMIPVLTNFLVFLENKGIIYNANVLCKELGKLRNQIVKAATNPKNGGMAKSLIMSAKKAGASVALPPPAKPPTIVQEIQNPSLKTNDRRELIDELERLFKKRKRK